MQTLIGWIAKPLGIFLMWIYSIGGDISRRLSIGVIEFYNKENGPDLDLLSLGYLNFT